MESLESPSRAAPAESVRAEVGDIPAIEGMRGVAVLWVLLFHYFVVRLPKHDDAFIAAAKAWTPAEIFVSNGYLGVDLFFLITGFLLTLPWFRHADAGLAAPDALAFYARRWRRILPAYYLQLVFLFFLAVPLLHPHLWLASTPFVVGNLGAHATFLYYTTPLTSASLSINGALWTLAIEFQYYLLLPFVAPLFVKWPWRSLVAAALIAAGWRWLAMTELRPVVDLFLNLGARGGVTESAARELLGTQLPAWALHFALGILSGRAWMLRRSARPASAAAWVPFAAVAIGAFALPLHPALRQGNSVLGPLGWLVSPLLIAAAFAAVVSWPSRELSRIVATPALAGLGRISYSAYLYHLPLLYLYNKFLPGAGGWIGFPLWFALVVAVSFASYTYVERPYLQRSVAGAH